MEEEVQHRDERQPISDPRRLSIDEEQLQTTRFPRFSTTQHHHHRHAVAPTSLTPWVPAHSSQLFMHHFSESGVKGQNLIFVLHGRGICRIYKRHQGGSVSAIDGSPLTLKCVMLQARAALTALHQASRQHGIASSRRIYLFALCSASTVHIFELLS